jgi:hypothetical protein
LNFFKKKGHCSPETEKILYSRIGALDPNEGDLEIVCTEKDRKEAEIIAETRAAVDAYTTAVTAEQAIQNCLQNTSVTIEEITTEEEQETAMTSENPSSAVTDAAITEIVHCKICSATIESKMAEYCINCKMDDYKDSNDASITTIVNSQTFLALTTTKEEREAQNKEKTIAIRPTKLYSTRADVERENRIELDMIEEESVFYETIDKGQPFYLDELNRNCQALTKIELKVGAQVMCLKNISFSAGLVNGSRGVVIGFTKPLSPDAIERERINNVLGVATDLTDVNEDGERRDLAVESNNCNEEEEDDNENDSEKKPKKKKGPKGYAQVRNSQAIKAIHEMVS